MWYYNARKENEIESYVPDRKVEYDYYVLK